MAAPQTGTLLQTSVDFEPDIPLCAKRRLSLTCLVRGHATVSEYVTRARPQGYTTRWVPLVEDRYLC